MTGFHLCPLDPLVRGFVRRKYLAENKKRIPIQKRAEQLLESTRIPFSEIQRICETYSGGEKSFTINGKICTIYCERNLPADLAAALVSHLATALEGEPFLLIVNRETNPFEVISCDLYSPPQKSPRNKHKLTFYIHPDFGRMELEYLESKGRGGRMMSALYNLARKLRLDRIEFTVTFDNIVAQNFYYHIDAGHPIDANNWVLPIPRGKQVSPYIPR